MSAGSVASTPSRTGHLNRWWYVVTGFLTLLFGTTTVNVLFNVLGGPMAEEFGWERSVISNGLSLETVLVGVSIVVLGLLIDRFGPRAPSVPMALLFGIGLMLMSTLQGDQVMFYALCVVMGLGAGAVNPIAHSTVVSAWFSERRGLALGILMAGLGACGVVMPFLANWVLGLAGWRTSFLVIGAICTIVPTAVYAFVTRMPAEYELERRTAREEGRAVGESLWTLLRKYRQFWLLSLSIFLVSSATFGLMSQVVPMTTDKGIGQATAVSILSVLSLASLAARLLVGYLLDRFYAPVVGAVIFAACALGAALMILSTQVGLLFVAALLIGLGLGAEGDIAAYMASRYFPRQSYGRALGFVYLLYAQGSAFGIFLLGQIFSVSGSYEAGAIPIIALVAVSVVCLLFMGPYRFTLDHREATETEPTARLATAD